MKIEVDDLIGLYMDYKHEQKEDVKEVHITKEAIILIDKREYILNDITLSHSIEKIDFTIKEKTCCCYFCEFSSEKEENHACYNLNNGYIKKKLIEKIWSEIDSMVPDLKAEKPIVVNIKLLNHHYHNQTDDYVATFISHVVYRGEIGVYRTTFFYGDSLIHFKQKLEHPSHYWIASIDENLSFQKIDHKLEEEVEQGIFDEMYKIAKEEVYMSVIKHESEKRKEYLQYEKTVKIDLVTENKIMVIVSIIKEEIVRYTFVIEWFENIWTINQIKKMLTTNKPYTLFIDDMKELIRVELSKDKRTRMLFLTNEIQDHISFYKELKKEVEELEG